MTGEKTKTNQEQITERIKTEPQPPAEQEQESPDYKIYNNTIYAIVDEYIDLEFSGMSQEELKKDRSFFPSLVQYIYNSYLGDLFKNKLDYKLQGIKPIYNNIKLLDAIFNIYLNLVYKYKWNNRPSILEFSILTGINRNTIHSWLNGDLDSYILQSVSDDKRKYITSEYASTVQKWQAISEQSLVDGNGELVKEIFLLKSVHGFKDSAPVEITVNHKAIVNADILPDLIGINSKD